VPGTWCMVHGTSNFMEIRCTMYHVPQGLHFDRLRHLTSLKTEPDIGLSNKIKIVCNGLIWWKKMRRDFIDEKYIPNCWFWVIFLIICSRCLHIATCELYKSPLKSVFSELNGLNCSEEYQNLHKTEEFTTKFTIWGATSEKFTSPKSSNQSSEVWNLSTCV
jgi:hypothetical protein